MLEFFENWKLSSTTHGLKKLEKAEGEIEKLT